MPDPLSGLAECAGDPIAGLLHRRIMRTYLAGPMRGLVAYNFPAGA